MNHFISESDLYYVGGSDRRASLFENLYPIPEGMSYNSYLLLDEKTVLFDTVDSLVADEFLANLSSVLQGRPLDYIIVHHMEPDHSYVLERLLKRYPQLSIVASQKASQMLGNFFPNTTFPCKVVKEGDTLSVGKHTLAFLSAPMVHWPEVIMTFNQTTGTLFSADAFGTFGALEGDLYAKSDEFERCCDEYRRYYSNIVGKFGAQVQNVLKKVQGLSVKTICPLHGPIWRENLSLLLEKYDLWSRYQPEVRGVALFYGSIYGHTAAAARILAEELAKKGYPVSVHDVSKSHRSVLLAEATRYSHVVFLSATFNNGVFLNMEHFLTDLGAHNYQNRKYALVENGSWAPQAGDLMQKMISAWKNMEKIGETITILSSLKEEQIPALQALARAIEEDLKAE